MEIFEVTYHTVKENNLACALGSGSLEVLATPQMIAWMEEASCKIAPIASGQTSVGIWMETSHDAPSALGARIRTVSKLVEVKGKILEYEVSAWCGPKKIGQGKHKRAIVNAENFMAKLNQ